MELYTLDSLLRRVAVIDKFESLIWAERFNSTGDFKLLVPRTQAMIDTLSEGTMLVQNDSVRVMVVENVEKKRSNGKNYMNVTGRSLEKVLSERLARQNWNNTVTTKTWNFTNQLPAEIARTIFNQICVAGILNSADIIPLVTPGTTFPTDTISEPTGLITLQIPPKTVYKAIKDICDLFELGFRFERDPYLNVLHFNIYAGSDRTTGQSSLNPVIFSESLDNLTDSTEFSSIEDAYNCAYVLSPIGSKIVYAENTDGNTAGFDRKVLFVNADDLTSAADVNSALDQRGLEALKDHRAFKAFDGEINQYSQYKYGVDYHLGDLVEVRNAEGFSNLMRVTEQIFVSDEQGDRSYPTLTINTSITPGSWVSWDFNQVWSDFDQEHWEDLP